jgi:uncharacterized protein (UPF0332 family)
MTDAQRWLHKSHESLIFARHALSGGFSSEAGRAAYMAAYHAAQAFILVRSGRTPKTHSGTRSEFTRLVQSEPSMSQSVSAFLGRAYELKAYADYDQTQPTTSVDAQRAIDEAVEFVEIVAKLL